MFTSLRITAIAALISFLPVFVYASDDTDRQSLIEFNNTFNKYAKALDIEGILSLYHKDTYWVAPATAPAQGRDGVPRQTVTFLNQNKGTLHHTIDQLFISDDGTQAVMMGETKAKVESKNFDLHGTYMYVLKRENKSSSWQIMVDMFNNYEKE
ncbi:YybH family protein [Kiloniella majae]|uniref:YybH family protein n=1 Tax=Kiloniella majae TaxID=1938558 RepID=UPI000A277CBD|nr:nuclear transport factor 2 family protein [Kiloniella majae]